jgi:HK97 family phage prohead protease
MPSLSPFRACSTVIWKSVDDDARVLEGVASSAAPDLAGDVLESRGAAYSLPMPLLLQHDRERPIGKVTAARVSDSDIQVRAEISRDSGLAYVDDAWKQIRAGLVGGLSIGAQPLKADPILDKGGKMTGVRYTSWRWLELSAVTLPMNTQATIEVVRAFDPWGAAAFAARHDPLADDESPDLEGYAATRARAIAAIRAVDRVLHRKP